MHHKLDDRRRVGTCGSGTTRMSAAGRSATPTLADPGMIEDHVGKSCRYLTDGVNLYRYVGTIPGSMGRMIGLENCHSLDLILWPTAEVVTLQLRSVTPAVTSVAEAADA